MFWSTVACIPLYLTFNLSFTIFLALDFAPVSFCVGKSEFVRFRGIRCKSCITSAGSGGFVIFFRSKHAYFALSQFKLFGELLVATFDKGVFGVRPMWASNGEIFVTLCGVILSV